MKVTNSNCTRVLAALSLAATSSCGGDLVLPTPSGEGVDLSILGGNGQTGTVGQELAAPLVVMVQSGSTPLRGHQIAFIIAGDAAGRLEPDTAVSGPDGRAVAHWVLGPEVGSFEVEARLVVSGPTPPPSALFVASAVAGAPDAIRAASPLSQPGRIGRPVAEDPTVLVVDRFGNPVGGTPVEWEVTAGGGTVSSPTTATGTDGKAAVTWTLGLSVGVQKLVVRVGSAHGSPITFTATVLF
jgi:hypothetical protein